ncbi:MAG: ROK family protein [Arenicella sp.]|nr:ROK family protein [Arenicella sp.]
MARVEMIYGLDIGGTKIEIAVYDERYELQASWRVDTPVDSYNTFLDTIVEMVVEADGRSKKVGTVGLGIPGYKGLDGRLVCSNIPCVNGKYLKQDLSQRLGRDVVIENDVMAFVYSESNGGVADGHENVLGVILGTGMSGALCINGHVYHGRQNVAGEYGHVGLSGALLQRYDFPKRACGCGSFGCVEKYLSGPGLLWMSSHFGAEYESVIDLVRGYQQKERCAVVVFNAYLDCLGSYLSELTKMFDPHVIVLGGGISNIGEIYDAIPSIMAKYVLVNTSPPKVVAAMYGDSSGVRGAAILGQGVYATEQPYSRVRA